MIITFDGETMSACLYGGHIFEKEIDGERITAGFIGEYQEALFSFELMQTNQDFDLQDVLVYHKGKLATLEWIAEEDGVKKRWTEIQAPYAVATNPKWAEVAIEMMLGGRTATEACSDVIAEIAQAGGMVNTQTV